MLTNFHPHAESAEFVLKELKTNTITGLSRKEAEKRQKEYGLNEIKEEKKFEILILILKQFRNPLVFLLLAAGILTLFLKEYHNSIIIFLAVLINSTVGFVQEKQMKDAFSILKSSLKKYSVVIREGEKQRIEARFIVPGDIIFLKEGDTIPADARIIEEKGAEVNESILTGEWLASRKNSKETDLKVRITERTNMIFQGTMLEKGLITAVVISTGEKTEFGKIAGLIRGAESIKKPAAFQKNITKVSRFIGAAVFLVIIILFFAGIYRGIDKTEMFLSAVAVSVAAVPEGLPIAVTVILVLGMRRIVKAGGLPKNLSVLETLGSVDTILTDKTGTLTSAKMQIARIITPFDANTEAKSQEKDLNPKGGAKKNEITAESLRIKVLEIAQFVSEAFIENKESELKNWIIRGDPLEKAIAHAGIEAGLNREKMFAEYPRIDLLPFDSERRFSASLHKFKELNKLFISGAPEVIIKNSASFEDIKKIKKLTRFLKDKFLSCYENEAAKGARIIAIASSVAEFSEIPRKTEELFSAISKKMIFHGFIAFHDPVRADAAMSLKLAGSAGIDIKILTGDNLNTAKAVASEIGLLRMRDIRSSVFLNGEDLENMNKDDLQEKIDDIKILSRILPHEKMMIVESLQAKGKIVAMTGDGINDAPALSRADVGIALESGTDIAKESADLILTNNNFNVIVAAMREGRVITENIRKVITYLLSTGFSEVILIGGSIAAGFPLPVLPAQILWANIIQEGFMNFAYAFEKESDGVASEGGDSVVSAHKDGVMKKENRVSQIFTREMKILIFIIGIITDIFLLILFFVLLKMNYDLDKIRTIMFVGLTSDAIFFALSLKSFKNPIWKINIFSNIYLIFALALSLFMLFVSLSLPFLRNLLELTPISGKEFLIVFTLGIINLITIEAAKLWMNRKAKVD